jgi:hypothetical protein
MTTCKLPPMPKTMTVKGYCERARAIQQKRVNLHRKVLANKITAMQATIQLNEYIKTCYQFG